MADVSVNGNKRTRLNPDGEPPAKSLKKNNEEWDKLPAQFSTGPGCIRIGKQQTVAWRWNEEKDTKCSTCESADEPDLLTETQRNRRRAASCETHVGTLASAFQKTAGILINVFNFGEIKHTDQINKHVVSIKILWSSQCIAVFVLCSLLKGFCRVH